MGPGPGFWVRSAALLCLLCLAFQALGQTAVSACGTAPVAARDAQPNIFSEQQEAWLGEAVADSLEGEMVPVRDPALSGHLQAIADRLVATLPATSIKFRVLLIDSSEVNGASIAGGHIYITRKLASVATSDDELAGVIGHEIGHIASHQFAFEMTSGMKRLLGVTSVGDRADVYRRYHAWMDAAMRARSGNNAESDADQDEADRIGIYAAAAAGYRPGALPEFWDRVFFVGGKTRGRVADFFGITKPGEKRLRRLRVLAGSLPSGCGGGGQKNAKDFAQWHEAVIANQKGEETASIKALREVELVAPLRMELDQVRFSPDGKSVLAQDESSVFVLSREPFALRYRIDAAGATAANFSPDSQSITFSTAGLHTEQWSAGEKKLLAAHEVLLRDPCFETTLTPDGRSLVCIRFNTNTLELSLFLIDTSTSEVVWEQKPWKSLTWIDAFLLYRSYEDGDANPLAFAYSASNSVLLLGEGPDKIALDLGTRKPIKLGGEIGSLRGGYAFVGDDKLATINGGNAKRSGLFSFPEGKKLQDLQLPPLAISSVTNGGSELHLLVHGAKDFNAGLGDARTSKVLVGFKARALDEYDGSVISETAGGGVGLLPLPEVYEKPKKIVELPLSPLATLRAVSASPSGRYLAASTHYRGAIWDMLTGKQIFLVHGFTDAAWVNDDTVYLDMPKQLNMDRHIAEVSLAKHSAKNEPYKTDDQTHMRYGRLTEWEQDPKKKTWTLSLHDPADDKVIWQREFRDAHLGYTASYGDRDLLFSFGLKTTTAKEAFKADPKLIEEAAAIKNKDGAQLLQVVNGKTGELAGSMVLELPLSYAGIDGVNRAGDLMYVTGQEGRTAVYSITTGKELRKVFGAVVALDPATGRVCTANRVGEAVVYDPSGEEVAHFHIGQPIRYAVLREQGKQLTLLTADNGCVRWRSMEARRAQERRGPRLRNRPFSGASGL